MTNRYSDIAKGLVQAGLYCIPPKLAGGNEELLNLFNNLYPEREMPDDFKKALKAMNLHGSEIAIPVSGGLDSSILYFRAKQQYGVRARAFYVDIGQSYRHKEFQALEDLGIKYETIFGEVFPKQLYWEHIIPGRNFYIFSLLAERIRGGHIFFGVTKGEMPESGGDKSKEFLKSVNTLFCKLPYPVTIETPLENETKVDLIHWWKKNLQEKSIQHTISCFSEEIGHCGKCRACLRKAMAFVMNDLTLQTNVPIQEGCVDLINGYRKNMGEALRLEDFSNYSKQRCEEDLEAINRLCVKK